jgi:hypothetical protein
MSSKMGQLSQAWRCIPGVPAAQEAEVGGFAGAQANLGNLARSHLKKQKQIKNI